MELPQWIWASKVGARCRGWGRIVNITSALVKSPVAELGLSNAARSGLTGFVAGVARQVAKAGVVINNLLPGWHETERAAAVLSKMASARGLSVEDVRKEAYAANPTGRFGAPAEFGAMAAFLCSQYAGYMIGQNILLDGGAFRSTPGLKGLHFGSGGNDAKVPSEAAAMAPPLRDGSV